VSGSRASLHLRVGAHAFIAVALFALTLVVGRLPSSGTTGQPLLALQVGSFSLPGVASTVPMTTVTRLESPAIPLMVQSFPSSAARSEAVLRASDSTQQALTALAERAASRNDDGTVNASRTQEQLPLFYRYEIQAGDTVSGIAGRFGIDSQYILWNNIDIISDQHVLAVGGKLQIPSVEGVLHQVKVGETLSDIAAAYGAKVSDIINFPANDLVTNPNLLVEGSTIIVPGGKITPKPAPSLRPVAGAALASSSSSSSSPSQPAAVTRPESRLGFIWPVVNSVTSYFGPSHPLGIDIEAPYVPVAAAHAGQVIFAGGDPCCSYGLNVIVRHDQGFETRYAHLSQINVKLGQFVETGQILGVSGATGRATGPHLHFEIMLNGVIQNPLLYLP
jgi:murein DD-endopeptidase MepM/ murein hydrolase activator NlpD